MITERSPSTRLALNLRCVLWRRQVPRSQWDEVVARLAQVDHAQARRILSGTAQPNFAGLERLARHFDRDAAVLSKGDLLEGTEGEPPAWILLENVRYLVRQHEGPQKGLARALDVDASTLSNWMNRDQHPRPSNVEALAAHMEVPRKYDLYRDPLFLFDVFVSDRERRTWLVRRIEGLSDDLLERYFPALERLLSDP